MRPGRPWRAVLGPGGAAWLAAAWLGGAAAAPEPEPKPPAAPVQLAWTPPVLPPTVLGTSQPARLHALEVWLNGAALGTWEVLEAAGGFWVTAEALQAWRLLLPAETLPMTHRQRLWWPLYAAPGYRAQFDEARQSLFVEVLPAWLRSTPIVEAPADRHRVAPALPALFLNYDLSWTHSRVPGGTRADAGLLTELGLSAGTGMLLSTQLTRGVQAPGLPLRTTTRRLETSWTRDWSAQDLRLRLGDTWTPASAWGREAAYGGLQLGTNRSFAPQAARLATPVLGGTALTPSTVELYVNDALRQTLQVPAGPFTLEGLAPLSGAGEARLVVRDLLGRETVLSRPFFTHPALFAPGRLDWSADAGRLRRGFALEAGAGGYGAGFAQVQARLGLHPGLSVEGRVQAAAELTNVGVGAAVSVADRALLETALAGSHGADRQGASALLALQTQGLREGLGLRVVAASRGYRELGRGTAEEPARLEAALNLRGSLRAGDAWGLTLAGLRRPDGEELRTGVVSYTQGLGGRGQLVWSASRLSRSGGAAAEGGVAPGAHTSLQVLAVLPLEARGGPGRTLVTAQLQRRQGLQPAPGADPGGAGDDLDALVTAQSPLPAETGWGWRAQAARRAGQGQAEAGLYRLGERARVSLDIAAGPGQSGALRGGLQGAWVVAERQLFAAQRIQDAFAVVEVPGQPGIGVSVDGLTLARTNDQGLALLPRLSAHQLNRVRLDANELPPEAEPDTLELAAVPPWRAGVKLRFAVREGRAARLAFLVAEGQPAPRGAVVQLAGDAREFVVGGRGEAYVTGLPPGLAQAVTLSWGGQRCEASVTWHAPAATAGEPPQLPRLGPFSCPHLEP